MSFRALGCTKNRTSFFSRWQPPSIVETLKPADVHKILLKQDNPVNMILEQASLGRGKHWYVAEVTTNVRHERSNLAGMIVWNYAATMFRPSRWTFGMSVTTNGTNCPAPAMDNSIPMMFTSFAGDTNWWHQVTKEIPKLTFFKRVVLVL